MARSHEDAEHGAERAVGPSSATLRGVIASVDLIDLVCAPRGVDVVVTEAVIHDPAAPPPIGAGALVLAVGVPGRSPDAIDLVRRAGDARAAAVALKFTAQPSARLRKAAEDAGVAVLALPAGITWSQAYSLVRTATNVPETEATDEAPLGDLFSLASAIAAMVGGAVTIEDRHSRVLAYSSQDEGVDEPRRQTILGRRVPDEWLQRLEEAGVFKRLWAGEVVRYQAGPGFDLRPRLAVAVRAGDSILGSIWVAEGADALGAEAEHALREASRIAALHLIRYRASDDIERNTRGELLWQVFDGAERTDEIAYRLGVDPDGAFAVLAFEPQSADEVEDALARERVLDLVTLYGEAFRNRSAAVRLGRTVYVLLPAPERSPRLVELARDIVARAHASLGTRLRAGIGSTVHGLREVPAARRQADQVLRALASDPTAPDIADFESAHMLVAMVELRDFASDRPHVRSRHVAALAEHDAQHGTRYVETLRAYLDAFGDIPRAARQANIHPNTFRYRLRRLVELSAVNLDDPAERLLAELDFRLGTD
jgi:DNA-binding PucR family transcriptional regulator